MWTQNNKVNGNGTTPINNYLKCKWVDCPNQKTMTGWTDTKTRPLYMLSTRDPPQNKGHIQTESEGVEKDTSCKWRPKESRSSNTHIRLNRLWNKGCEKRQRSTLHNDQRINPRIRYNNYKYICTQHRSIEICKANASKYERGN